MTLNAILISIFVIICLVELIRFLNNPYDKKIKSSFRKFIILIVLVIISIVFIFQSMIVNQNVAYLISDLEADRRYVISKVAYLVENPSRGDLIVFYRKGFFNIVSRVIGLPGDQIKIERGLVFINGEPLKEDYVLTRPAFPS